MRLLHSLFRNTDICRLDCTQVQSSPTSCVRKWPVPDAAGEGRRESVEFMFLQVGKTSSYFPVTVIASIMCRFILYL